MRRIVIGADEGEGQRSSHSIYAVVQGCRCGLEKTLLLPEKSTGISE